MDNSSMVERELFYITAVNKAIPFSKQEKKNSVLKILLALYYYYSIA